MTQRLGWRTRDARRWAVLALMAALLGLGVWGSMAQAPAPEERPLSSLIPAGPLLVMESADFSTLLRDWNNSPEKTLWLDSPNYQAFSRSKLFLRLKQAHQEFAAAAGFPADMALADSVAGAETALALYDIGNLEFLYVTGLPSARTVESVIWQSRAAFEPRNVAGRPYYVRTDPKSQRMVAFVATDDYLLLATREDLLVDALRLLAGEDGATVTNEAWYRDAVSASASRGDPRLVLDMAALARSPHFRSYWIQGNVSQMRQYRAGIADLHRREGEFREERVFLRREAGDSSAVSPEALVNLVRLVPEQAGLYRAWTQPDLGEVLTLLQQKILAPRTGQAPPSRVAPGVYLGSGQVGSEAALETRIDEPPPTQVRGVLDTSALADLLQARPPRAMLQVQSSRLPSEQSILLGNSSVIVLRADADWNPDAAREALRTAVEGLWTTSDLGTRWRSQGSGETAYDELDGLGRLAVAARGPYLAVANDAARLVAVLQRMASPPSAAEPAHYAAGFRRSQEHARYETLMRHLDYLELSRYGASPNRPPAFFSENLASLSRTLARVESIEVAVRDQGSQVSQTVTYRLNR